MFAGVLICPERTSTPANSAPQSATALAIKVHFDEPGQRRFKLSNGPFVLLGYVPASKMRLVANKSKSSHAWFSCLGRANWTVKIQRTITLCHERNVARIETWICACHHHGASETSSILRDCSQVAVCTRQNKKPTAR